MKTGIFETLKKLGLSSLETRTLLSQKTRDVDNLCVWRDAASEVIYIDDYYTGDQTYESGAYLDQLIDELETGKPDFERISDLRRRLHDYTKFVAGKRVADFGCGSGDFLRSIQPHCSAVLGVEIQKNYADQLNSDGIPCVRELREIKDRSLDVVVSYHVIEHLPDPIRTLKELNKKLLAGEKL